MRKDGYDYVRFGPQAHCQFTAVEFRRHGKDADRLVPEDGKRTMSERKTDAPPSDVFIVRATCERDPAGHWNNDEDTWTESFEIQTSNDWLRFEDVDEG
jgi:hypothetical protein